MNFFKRIHWSAVGSLALTAIGVLADPQVLGFASHDKALTMIAVGAAAQAVSKRITDLKPSGDSSLSTDGTK